MNSSKHHRDKTTRVKTFFKFAAVLMLLFVFASLFASLLMPGVGSGPVAPTAVCGSNLYLIGYAMRQYHEEYGCFPPAYVADEDGRPLHSWRVLLLPFLDATSLYARYNFDEPWDGPNNLLLLDSVPISYQCPTNGRDDTRYTSYLAIIGPNCAWRGSQSVTMTDLGDDLSNRILLVEVADTDIPWTKPEDFELSKMEIGINKSDTEGISSFHCRDWTYQFKNGKPGANVLFADGHREYLRATGDSLKLREMLTIPRDDGAQLKDGH